jgi:hypothetical protein
MNPKNHHDNWQGFGAISITHPTLVLTLNPVATKMERENNSQICQHKHVSDDLHSCKDLRCSFKYTDVVMC